MQKYNIIYKYYSSAHIHPEVTLLSLIDKSYKWRISYCGMVSIMSSTNTYQLTGIINNENYIILSVV
jgi:hypothetical protein